jgi:hypothetical protein
MCYGEYHFKYSGFPCYKFKIVYLYATIESRKCRQVDLSRLTVADLSGSKPLATESGGHLSDPDERVLPQIRCDYKHG